MLGAIFGIISTIFSFLASVPVWILAVFTVIFLSLSDLGKDILSWVFEQFLEISIFALNIIPADFSMFNPSTYISSLPPELVDTMILLNIPQCLGIITSALVIRVFLQLIPFVRLGS